MTTGPRDGDGLVIDMAPAPAGRVGQVFAYSRMEGPTRLVAASYPSWLALWREHLEAFPVRDLDEEDEEDDDDIDYPSSPIWPD